MPLSGGTRLGHYEIVALIGAGGMGEVYRARDTRLKRDVALKVLPEAFAGDPDRMARFQREAEVLASLNHPNIAHIYGVEDRALAMELVEGESPQGPLPLDRALGYARQIAEALEYAHEKGVVHRDLKPANIKVTSEGVVKLLDFGLAKAIEDPISAAPDASNSPTLTLGATRMGVVLGTAAYMPPEQASGKPVDRRADIWSFGAVLYEMLAGRKAFDGESVADTLASVLKLEPDWSALPATTPAPIRNLILRCLTKDRKQRLQAIGEARIVLQAPRDTEAPPRAESRSARLPWAVAVGLAVLAAALGSIAWRATRPVERPLIQLNAELAPDTSLALQSGGSVALSPDGKLLALVIRGADGKTHLATRRIDQSEVTELAGTEGAAGPFFSPDARWIAFSAIGGLKKIAAQGGSVVKISDAPSMSGSCGMNGTIVGVFGVTAVLSRVPESGGTPVPITQLKPGEDLGHRWPQVLPGSESVLFTVYMTSRDMDESDIDVVSLQTGARKTIYHGGYFARYLPSGHLVFIHQNTLFAAPFDLQHLVLSGAPQPVIDNIYNQFDNGGEFDYSQTGAFVYLTDTATRQRSIFWLDTSGRTDPLQPVPGLYTYPRFSPDGKRLAYALDDSQGHTGIWVQDLERNTTQRLTSLPGRNTWPIWTPDGRALIFDASDPAAPGVYWMRSDGSGQARLLLAAKDRLRAQAISPDGKWLAVIHQGDPGIQIMTVPITYGADGAPRLGTAVPFAATPFITIYPAFSADGQWIAHTSSDPGNRGILVRPFPGPGGQWNIDSTGTYPVFSRTGHELFYLSDRRIMAASYTANGNTFVWEKPRVWSEKRVLNLGSPPYSTYDVAPDGKRSAVVLYTDGTADEKPVTHVTFLLNFFDELRRRVPPAR